MAAVVVDDDEAEVVMPEEDAELVIPEVAVVEAVEVLLRLVEDVLEDVAVVDEDVERELDDEDEDDDVEEGNVEEVDDTEDDAEDDDDKVVDLDDVEVDVTRVVTAAVLDVEVAAPAATHEPDLHTWPSPHTLSSLPQLSTSLRKSGPAIATVAPAEGADVVDAATLGTLVAATLVEEEEVLAATHVPDLQT